MSKENAVKFWNVLLFLLTLNLLAGNLGLSATPLVSRIAAFYLMVGLAIFNFPFKGIVSGGKISSDGYSGRTLVSGALLIVLSLLVLFIFREGELWLFALSAFIFGLDLMLQGAGSKREEFFVLSLSSFLSGMIFIYLHDLPGAWRFAQTISVSYSGLIGRISDPLKLGASASGFWIVLTSVIFSTVLFLFSKAGQRKLKSLILTVLELIVCWAIFLAILAFNLFKTDEGILNVQFILFILCMIPVSIFAIRSGIRDTDLRMIPFSFSKRGILPVTAVILLLLLSGIALTGLYGSNPEKGEVVLYFPGVGDYDIPRYGIYGRTASGFFGLMPGLLDSTGYTSRIVKEDIIPEMLENASVLTIINLADTFSTEEHAAIWDFVEGGGSLLVLGDHTDLMGIMGPMNRLLEPSGISFNFDSSLPLRERWTSCFHMLRHPVTRGITEDQLPVSVGATLEAVGLSFPVVVGKYGASDWGDYSNTSRAYLGDYEYSPGEHVGDVILVAGRHYGRGKVLVFGDTSPFQNPSLAYSYEFMHNVFSWLTGGGSAGRYNLQNAISLIFFAAAVFFAIRQRKKGALVLFPLVLSLSLIVSGAVDRSRAGSPLPGGSVAYIDYSHGERFNYMSSTDDSVDGLIVSILRNDYACYYLKEFTPERIGDSRILFLINPTERFKRGEVEFLKEYVSNGGLLVLNTGYNFKEAVMPVLDEFGFDIMNAPLGPVPYIEENPEKHRMEPKFVDAYPILSSNEDSESFFSVKIEEQLYDLVVFRKISEGGILLISDSGFLLNDNLESMFDYWPGNIKFFKDIMDKIAEQEVPKSKG